MIANNLQLVNEYHQATGFQFNLRTREGCGKWTEGFVTYANPKDKNIGHLRKYGAQTQYNDHAVDAICYYDPSRGTYQSVDLIFAAESENPNETPKPVWVVQEIYYQAKDWYLIGSNPMPNPTFPGYEELGGDQLCRVLVGMPLLSDYTQAGKPLDDGSVVWTNRTLYTALQNIFVKNQSPEEGYRNAVSIHRPEWRKELGL